MGRKQKAKAAQQALVNLQSLQQSSPPVQPRALDAANEKTLPACLAALKEFCSGSRSKAKKALRKLAKACPTTFLPYRLLARVLYHEAAHVEASTAEADQDKRLSMLQEAVEAAKQATLNCPGSLSSAALRVVLALNLLVESSGFFCGNEAARLPGTKQSQAVREQIQGALEACRVATETRNPLADEPMVVITGGGEHSSDPCLVESSEAAERWKAEGHWVMLALEKRRVLGCMQTLLESCQPLVQRPDFSINAIVAVLMDLIRPYQKQSPAWPDQLLCKGLGLVALQKKLSDPTGATAQLVKVMRECGELRVVAPPPNAVLPSPNFSVERNWDTGKDALAAARRRTRARGDRRAEMTMQERHDDVRSYWTRLASDQRRDLLRVPVFSLLENLLKENGPQSATEMHQGLLLLQSQESRRACYWSCPFCPGCRVGSVKEYLAHIEANHEEVQATKDGPIMCITCDNEVVGMHFQSRDEPGLFMCLRCHYLETSTGKLTPGMHPFNAVPARMSTPRRAGHDSPSSEASLDSSEADVAHPAVPPGNGQSGGDVSPQTSLELCEFEPPWPGARHELDPPPASQSDASARHPEDLSSTAKPPVVPDNSPVADQGRGVASPWRLPKQLQRWQLAATSKLSALVSSQDCQASSAQASSDGEYRESAPQSGVMFVPGQQPVLPIEGGRVPEQEPSQGKGRVIEKSRPEQEIVTGIMQHINRLWSYNHERFGATLDSIVSKAAELLHRHLAGRAGQQDSFQSILMDSFQQSLQHPRTLEAALRRLPLPDLQSLAHFISSTPAGIALAKHPCMTASVESHRFTLENLDEAVGCPPLFELRNASSKGALERAVSAVLPAPGDRRCRLEPDSPELVVQPWWLDHLHCKEKEQDQAAVAGELKVLQWVYGNIVSSAAEEFLERRRQLLAEKQPDLVMLELIEDIAECWRRLREATEQKRHLEFLRTTAKKALQDVRGLEKKGFGGQELLSAAQTYYNAFMPVYQKLNPDHPAPFCHTAAAQMGNHQILSSNKALRFAATIVDRERCILELERAVFDHEVTELQVEAQQATERLEQVRAETAEAEAEMARTQAEGPANHRKKDHIDKATKEAEHRERLSDLRARIESCKERSALECGACQVAQKHEDAAQTELDFILRQQQEAEAHASNLAVVQQMNPEEQTWQELLGSDPLRWQTSIQEAWSRLLYVAHAINVYHTRDFLNGGTREGEVFMRTQQSARQCIEHLEYIADKDGDALRTARAKLQELSCVDLSLDITDKALDIVRSQIETAATAAKEAASQLLLSQLADEEAASKAKEKAAKKGKGKPKLEKRRPPKVEEGTNASQQPGASIGGDDNPHQQRAEAARQAAIMEYEAALEARRKEVEAENQRHEEEHVRQVAALMERSQLEAHAAGHSLEQELLLTDHDADDESSSEGGSEHYPLSEADPASLGSKSGIRSFATAEQEGGLSPDAWPLLPRSSSPLAQAIKKRNRRQRFRENKDKSKAMQPAESTQPQLMRITSYLGDWTCGCGCQNRLWDACTGCGHAGPCRDWVRGHCKYLDQCRFAHPPFQLPAGTLPSAPIARPAPGAPLLDVAGVLLADKPPPRSGSQTQRSSTASSAVHSSDPPAAEQDSDGPGHCSDFLVNIANDPRTEPRPQLVNRTPRRPTNVPELALEEGAAPKGSLCLLMRSHSLSHLEELEAAPTPAHDYADDVAPGVCATSQQDVVVMAPRRATSAKSLKQNSPTSAQMSETWVPVAGPLKAFDPFGDNPIMQAFISRRSAGQPHGSTGGGSDIMQTIVLGKQLESTSGQALPQPSGHGVAAAGGMAGLLTDALKAALDSAPCSAAPQARLLPLPQDPLRQDKSVTQTQLRNPCSREQSAGIRIPASSAGNTHRQSASCTHPNAALRSYSGSPAAGGQSCLAPFPAAIAPLASAQQRQHLWGRGAWPPGSNDLGEVQQHAVWSPIHCSSQGLFGHSEIVRSPLFGAPHQGAAQNFGVCHFQPQ